MTIRSKTVLAWLTCLLGVPSTVAALYYIQTEVSQPYRTLCIVVSYALLVPAILAGMAVFIRRWARAARSALVAILQRWVEPAVSSWIASLRLIRHRAQAEAALEARRYPESMRREPRLLEMSVREFARRAEVHVIVAWAILRNPDIIPRPDLWRPIEKALLLPDGLFERPPLDRRKYGYEITRARLEWYVNRNMASIHLSLDDPRLTDQMCVTLVRRIEATLLEGLDAQNRGGQQL